MANLKFMCNSAYILFTCDLTCIIVQHFQSVSGLLKSNQLMVCHVYTTPKSSYTEAESYVCPFALANLFGQPIKSETLVIFMSVLVDLQLTINSMMEIQVKVLELINCSTQAHAFTILPFAKQ